MANVQAPFGLRLLESEGKQFRVRRYVKKTGAAIFEGDLVIQDAAGNVTIATAGVTVIGVAMESKVSGDITPIAVCDDPDAVFEIQSDDGVAAADVFQNADVTATAGSTTLNRSLQDLDVASFGTGSTKQLKILGLSAISDNAYGSFVRMKVKINNHAFKAGVSGV